jgi:hypothetical protein
MGRIDQEPTVADAPEEAVAAPLTETRFLVVIHPGESEASKQPVPLTLNGRTVVVQRGVKVGLTKEYLEVLERAEERAYTASVDGRLEVSSGVARYPYSVAGQEEVPIGSLDTRSEANNASA